MFQLSRSYAWVSIFLLILTAAILSAVYSHFQVVNLKNMGERDSVALTQSFANTLGAELVNWVTEAASMPADEIKVHAQTGALLAQAKRQMRGTDVSKIKIYGLNGNTVFSSEIKQIGEDKSSNSGFQRARSGKVAIELTHRDTFSAFEQVMVNRNLLATYIPIRDPQTAKVVVVFELYNDVTELLEQMERTGRQVLGAVALILAAVFGALFSVVRIVERRLRTEKDRLQSSLLAANSSRDELAEKLKESVAQLQKTEAGMAAAWASARQSDLASSELLTRIVGAVREPFERIVAVARKLADTHLDPIQRGQMNSILENSESLRNSVIKLLERANALHLPPEARLPSTSVAAVDKPVQSSESSSPIEAEFRIS